MQISIISTVPELHQPSRFTQKFDYQLYHLSSFQEG